jgi:hypothetical protein
MNSLRARMNARAMGWKDALRAWTSRTETTSEPQ